MCTYVYIYTYMYLCRYIYICIYVYTYICSYIHSEYVLACVCLCERLCSLYTQFLLNCFTHQHTHAPTHSRVGSAANLLPRRLLGHRCGPNARNQRRESYPILRCLFEKKCYCKALFLLGSFWLLLGSFFNHCRALFSCYWLLPVIVGLFCIHVIVGLFCKRAGQSEVETLFVGLSCKRTLFL